MAQHLQHPQFYSIEVLSKVLVLDDDKPKLVFSSYHKITVGHGFLCVITIKLASLFVECELCLSTGHVFWSVELDSFRRGRLSGQTVGT